MNMLLKIGLFAAALNVLSVQPAVTITFVRWPFT